MSQPALSVSSTPAAANDAPRADAGQGPRTFRQLFVRRMLDERPALAYLLGGALLQSLLGLVGPWSVGKAIDIALPEHAPRLLVVCLAIAVLAASYSAALGWLHERTMAAVSRKLEGIVLEVVLENFLGLDFERMQSRTFGVMIETTRAASLGTVALVRALVEIVPECVSILAIVIFLASWFPAISLALVGAAAVTALAAWVPSRREARLARRTFDVSCEQNELLNALLLSVRGLRVAGATQRALEDWKGRLLRQAEAVLAQERARVSQSVVLQVAPQLVTLGTLLWSVPRVIAGDVSLGQMMTAILLVGTMMRALATVLKSLGSIEAMRPRLASVDQLWLEARGAEGSAPREAVPRSGLPVGARLAHPSDVPAPSHALRPIAPALGFCNVWYRYGDNANWVLEDYTEAFDTGRITLVRARSGAGKTTRLRLLAGLLRPQRGQVSVLGRCATEARELVAYLPQQSALFEASIATNLELLSGRPAPEALDVARHTGLERWMAQLPMRAETLVSSGGGNLSGGQRQLILLTAAFATGRPVILLDEPTSQLDAATRALIDWEALANGRTVVSVEHV